MQTKPFNNFSGGFTDKIIPGQENRYVTADNLLIDADTKLFLRKGFNILSSTAYTLPAVERVAKLVNFDFDSEIIAAQNKKVFAISGGAWAEVTGPTNSAFPQNTAASLIEEAQANHHLYLASDSGDLPIKMYRDGSNVMRLRTAGLPKPAVTNDYGTDAAKLAAAITLAVDIKTQLKAHVDDYGVSPAAHIAQDAAVSAALGALATPVTLANLIAYTKTLRTQYKAHWQDTQESLTNQVYHSQLSDLLKTPTASSGYVIDPILNYAPNKNLPTDANLDTIDEVIRVLNDLRTIYNWHALAPITHNNATQTSASWGAHFVTTDIIDISKTTPSFLKYSNHETLYTYVNRLKAEYNAHANNAASLSGGFPVTGTQFYHLTADSSNLVKMADATDLCTSLALLGCIYFHYSEHWEAANRKIPLYMGSYFGFYESASNKYIHTYNGSVTPGSPNITVVSPSPASMPPGYFIIKDTNDSSSPYAAWRDPVSFQIGNVVSSTGAATITMSGNASASPTATLAFHWNQIHRDMDLNPAASLPNSSAGKKFRDLLGKDYFSLEAVEAVAEAISGYLKAHETSSMAIDTGTPIFLGKEGYTYYKNVSDLTTENISPHSSFYDSTMFYPLTYETLPENTPQNYFEQGLTVATYLYRYVYKYTYTVGSTSFIDVSAPSEPIEAYGFVSPPNPTSGDTTWLNSITIDSIPALANTANTNYDTAAITLEFYRTIADGTTYYLTKSFTNGAASSFTDYNDDVTLLTKEALYTSGGAVANDAPPAASLIHSLDNRMYYVVKNKIYQSLVSDPDSVPATFFDTFEEDITAISSTRSNLVAFSSLNVYRLDGQFDDLGNGFMRHERIFDRTGCVAQQGVVKADNGIFFVGKDGFYFTDGYQCFRVTDFEDTFAGYTLTTQQKKAITGAYDNIHKKIFWTIETTNAFTSPNLIIVLDLQFGIKKDFTPCTTFSGGFDGYTGFNPTTLMFYQNALYYGDKDGYIFFQDPNSNLDLRKDLAVAATSWEKRTILWDYKSCHDPYGTSNFRKYFTHLNIEFEQTTNLSVQINSDADKGRVINSLPIIRSRKLLDWGDSKIDWTSSVYTAKDGGVIDEFRRFRADGSLRSNYRSIELKNAYCVVVASTIMGNIDVTAQAANLWNLTLLGAPTYKWPLYSVGYFVRIAGVDYPVTVRVSDSVVRVSDAGLAALSVQSNIAWEMWGYPKNETMKLIGFDVNYEIMGQTQKDYQGTTSTDGGEND